MNDKLKPCPFCGTEIKLTKLYNAEYMGDYAIQCPNCCAWGPGADTKAGAIEAWNWRDDHD